MRIAYCSPLRPQASGVSDYSEELLPHLARHVEITLITDDIVPTNLELAAFPKFDLRELDARANEFDAVVYHIGNAPLYANFYNAALQTRGVIVLHDVVLHHLRAWQTLERGDTARYLDALRAAYGDAVAEHARANPASIHRFDYPLSEEVLQNARGVIVHSEYAARFARHAAPRVPVAQVPMGIAIEKENMRDDARAELNLPRDAFLISAFGEIHPHKRVTVALEAFAEFFREQADARLFLIGSESPNYDVTPLLHALEIENVVTRVGFVEMDAYQNYIAASDVCLNLRYPTAGESSASLLRLLAAGKTTFVTRTGAYAELPDDVCVKIEPDAYEKNLLMEYLKFFAAHADARERMGANARAYVKARHTLERAAMGYAEFLRDNFGVNE